LQQILAATVYLFVIVGEKDVQLIDT